MIAGIKGDVAIHIYGDDFDKMLAYGQQDAQSAQRDARRGRRQNGAAHRIALRSISNRSRRRSRATGSTSSDVLDTIETIGGRIVGQVVEGDARYLLAGALRARRFRESTRDRLDDIKVAAPDGKLIPLAQLAHFTMEEGPVSIWRENLTRRVTVAVNVRGTDLGSFVSAARRAIAGADHAAPRMVAGMGRAV